MYHGLLVLMKFGFAMFAVLASIYAIAQAVTPSQAIALEQLGKWAEAVQAWQEVVNKSPHDAAAIASMGVDLARLQRYREAAAAYRKALKLDPKLPGIRLNLGLA